MIPRHRKDVESFRFGIAGVLRGKTISNELYLIRYSNLINVYVKIF